MLKSVYFFNFDFLAFFSDFSRFWLDFGRPRAVKKFKKIEKIDFVTRSVLKEGSGRVLGGFWDGSERIFMGLGCIFGGFGGHF